MSDEWGPWVDAMTDMSEFLEGRIAQCVMVTEKGEFCSPVRVIDCELTLRMHDLIAHMNKIRYLGGVGDIHYRIRKPKGLTILQGILGEVDREDEVV